jgi:hypothetical protein
MTYSRDTTLLTPAEIEELREDNRRAAALARELIRAEIRENSQAAEKITETARQLQAAQGRNASVSA